MKAQRIQNWIMAGIVAIVVVAGFSSIVFAKISNPPSGGLSSPVGVSDGGTGLTTWTAGSVVYASAAGTLAGTTTANLKTTLALDSVENTALSTWAGTSNITTLGTIGTGVWNATTLTVGVGGTGATTLTGLLQGNGTSAFTAVTGTAGQYPYYNGSNTLAATSTISLDTTGRVGIASTTPQRKLSVDGSVAIQEATLSDGATVTWNLRDSSYARVVLGGNRTLDITNASEAIGQSVRLVVCASGGAYSITSWDALIMWPGATAPTQTATDGNCDVFSGFVTGASSTPKIFLGSVLAF